MEFNGFSADERAWLSSQKLGRLATVSPGGIVGNAPYLEIRGTAEALSDAGPPADGFSPEVIRIHPDWVKSFNLPAAST